MHTSENEDHIHLRPYFSPLNIEVLKNAIDERVINLSHVSNLVLGHVASGYNFSTKIQFNANFMSLDVDIPTQVIICSIGPAPLTQEAARYPFVPTVSASDMLIVMSDCTSDNIGTFNIDFNLSELNLSILDSAYETGKEYVTVRPRENIELNRKEK